MTCETLFFITSTVEIALLFGVFLWISVIGFSMFLCPMFDSWKEYWKAKQVARLEEYWQIVARIERLEKKQDHESPR